MRLTIDEVIEHCNRTCDMTEEIAKAKGHEIESIESKQFWEHYQVREWLKELKQYREIGTLEELQKAKEQYDDINSVAKQTALMGLSDFARAKEAVKTEIKRSLDYSLKEYQKIGTVEELKALKEKSEPKIPNYEGDGYYAGQIVLDTWICPECGKAYEVDYEDYEYCPNCGQHIDHSSLTEDT